MSTRKLIIAALLCGLAILVAFTVQLTMVANNQTDRPAVTAPGPTATSGRSR